MLNGEQKVKRKMPCPEEDRINQKQQDTLYQKTIITQPGYNEAPVSFKGIIKKTINMQEKN